MAPPRAAGEPSAEPEVTERPIVDHPISAERRAFLTRVSLALGGLGAAVIGAPLVGFLLAPLLKQEPDFWRPVGVVDTFAVGTTVHVTFEDASSLPWAGVAGRTAAWLRRENATEFRAFSINCTHLGCPVRWLAEADLFMCPCHGGVFYGDGSVASGPPAQPLAEYPVQVRNGQVEIRTSAVPISG